jgi:hypothetical protein
MTPLNAKITKLKAQIQAKRIEVVELSDSLALLTTPPKYEIAAGQLPFFEQVRSLIAAHQDDEAQGVALNAAQSVLENAQGELSALEKELERLETERDCGLAIAEIKQAAAAYNTAAKTLLTQSDELQEVSRRHGTLLHRAGYSVNFFTSGLRSSFRFAIASENGSVYARRLFDLKAEQRIELGLE